MCMISAGLLQNTPPALREFLQPVAVAPHFRSHKQQTPALSQCTHSNMPQCPHLLTGAILNMRGRHIIGADDNPP